MNNNMLMDAPTLPWLIDRAALDDDGRAVLAAGGAGDPDAAARRLVAAGRPADGIRLVAAALPPREGVWWAWVSARHAVQVVGARGTPVPPTVSAALAAVERWIAQPTDETRRAAWASADAAGLETPAGSGAAAAYFSGGSIAPESSPAVPPPPGLHTTMIATAVTLAAAADPSTLTLVANAYLDQANEIVKQLGGWDAATAVARRYHEAQRAQHDEFATAGQPASGGQ
jgi:hypothetical protein